MDLQGGGWEDFGDFLSEWRIGWWVSVGWEGLLMGVKERCSHRGKAKVRKTKRKREKLPTQVKNYLGRELKGGFDVMSSLYFVRSTEWRTLPPEAIMRRTNFVLVAETAEKPAAGEQKTVPSMGLTLRAREAEELVTKSVSEPLTRMCWKLWICPLT